MSSDHEHSQWNCHTYHCYDAGADIALGIWLALHASGSCACIGMPGVGMPGDVVFMEANDTCIL